MSTCKTILIPDNPVSKDEFGSHYRVAEAIYNLIATESSGGKTIGLEGEWGTGKSTIIKILSSKLDSNGKNDKYAVVIFDAWAHREDPLRRTFLESVIRTIMMKPDWVDRKRWQIVLDEIAQRIKIEKTNTNSILKPWAKAFILGTIITPVSTIYFNRLLDSTEEYYKNPLFWVFLVLSINPILILALRLIWGWIKKSTSDSNCDDIFSFINQKSTTDTRTTTYQTTNPTSIEFEEKFHDLLNEAFEDKSRKVVLILDNLDRIESNEALTLLSTLQTFFQYDSVEFEWTKNIWAIIPYDKQGLLCLWSKDNGNRKIDQEGKDEEKSNKSSNYAISFIDKKFQIVFDVPPLLLSNWSSFLIENLLSRSFPNHSDQDFHLVYRVYALYRENPNSIPTPRELILYVNQIGALHRQWHDSYPLCHYGFYVLQKRANINIISNITKGNYQTPELQALLGDNINSSMMGLAFNVESDKAQEIIIREELDSIFRKNDLIRFNEISKLPGFALFLEDIKYSNRIVSEPIWVLNAAHLLYQSNIFENIDQNKKHTIITDLLRALVQPVKWQPFTKEIITNLIELIRLTCPDITTIIKVINGLSSTTLDDKSEKNIEINTWIDGTITLLEYLNSTYPKEEYEKISIVIPTSSTGYIYSLSYLHQVSPNTEISKVYKTNLAETELESTYVNIVKQDKYTPYVYSSIELFHKLNPEVVFNSFLNEISTRLQNQNPINADILIAYLSTLLLFHSINNNSKQYLKDFCQLGFIFHHLHNSQNNPKAVALCLLCFFIVFPDLRNVNTTGNSEAGRSYLTSYLSAPDNYSDVNNAIVESLWKYELLSIPFTLSNTPNTKKWISAILKILVNKDFIVAILKPDIVLKYWTVLHESYNEPELIDIFTVLVLDNEFIKSIINNGFDEKYFYLYTIILKSISSQQKEYISWCKTNLSTISEEILYSQINSGGKLIDLIIELSDKGEKIPFNSIYQDCLFKHIQANIKGNPSIQIEPKAWQALIYQLSDSSKDILTKRIFDSLLTLDGEISDTFFEKYGMHFTRWNKLCDFPEMILKLLTPIIRKQNAKGVLWIKSFVEANIKLFRRYSSHPSIIDFDNRLQTAIESISDDSIVNILKDIQSILKVSNRSDTLRPAG